MTLTSYQHCGLEEIDANGPDLLLGEHHQILREAGRELLELAKGDDHRGLPQTFRTFEHQVREHLVAEELSILPEYTVADPAAAARVRADHAVLRAQLDRSAVEIELLDSRVAAIETLLVYVESHARREDCSMYPWAQVHLPRPAHESLFTRLRHSFARLVAH